MRFCSPVKDLPDVPKKFITLTAQQAYKKDGPDLTKGLQSKEYYDRTLQQGSKRWKSSRTHRLELGEQFRHWAMQNITDYFTEISINLCKYSSASLGPHVDSKCNFRLMWLIDAGGDHVTTKWYLENDKDLHPTPGHYVTDYDNLLELESIIIPVNEWWVIDTRVLHSVENLVRDRISIQLFLPDCNKFLINKQVEFDAF